MRVPDGAAAAIVLAGGSGARVGAAGNKVYLPLAGRPMISWSVATFLSTPGIGPVLLVVRAEDRQQAARVLAALPGGGAVRVVAGGGTRQESELAGLRALAGRIDRGEVDVVLLHDGARPAASRELVTTVLETARAVGGAVPGLPRADLARAGTPGPDRAAGGRLAGPAPAGLVAMQTPQGFRAGPLLAAYEAADRCGFTGTDTASCVQRFAPAVPIRVVPGEERNIKVTYPHDVPVAEHALTGFHA